MVARNEACLQSFRIHLFCSRLLGSNDGSINKNMRYGWSPVELGELKSFVITCNLSRVLLQTADFACNYSRYKRHAGKRRTGLNKYGFKTNVWIKETPLKCIVDLYLVSPELLCCQRKSTASVKAVIFRRLRI